METSNQLTSSLHSDPSVCVRKKSKALCDCWTGSVSLIWWFVCRLCLRKPAQPALKWTASAWEHSALPCCCTRWTWGIYLWLDSPVNYKWTFLHENVKYTENGSSNSLLLLMYVVFYCNWKCQILLVVLSVTIHHMFSLNYLLIFCSEM